ncbi:MAG: glycoside hydrolase family 15 protein [Actinomycetales bacterium]
MIVVPRSPGTAAIGDYALLGDLRTAALVGIDGSIDWWCAPRFDSPACFAAVLGDPGNGRWRLTPSERASVDRHYDPGSLTLHTKFTTSGGVVELIDVLDVSTDHATLVRILRGIEGTVRMDHELAIRFGYGRFVPWLRRIAATAEEGGERLEAIAGPDRLTLRGSRLPHAHGWTHHDEFDVEAGQELWFTASHSPSHLPTPEPVDATGSAQVATAYFRQWSRHTTYQGQYAEQVERSLTVLRALTHRDLGGVVAAPTTSLPEQPGGERNWDYRYCWLRDSALTLQAFLDAGYVREAVAWQDWLVRAVAGNPAQVQIMYGVDGSRDLPERELTHLSGFADSTPVRIGNAAVDQKQGDVIGEVMVALEVAREHGVPTSRHSWAIQAALADHVARAWREPDQGIWEIRGPARAFTHSRAMAWAALDRAVAGCTRHDLPGQVQRWTRVRDEIHEAVMRENVSAAGYFVQHSETDEVDASVLLLAEVGFCEATDPRFVATVDRIGQDLVRDGLVLRYRTGSGVDGLSGDENPFLACTFWYVSALARIGRITHAREAMDRAVATANDVGLLAEEYDPRAGQAWGNMPQALSHLALVSAALTLHRAAAAPGTRGSHG